MTKNQIDIVHGNCLDVMENILDDHFDLTVTSPPYDNLRSYRGSLDWNRGIWRAVIKELYRTTKKGGVVVWIVGDSTINKSETGTSFSQALWAKECGFNLYDTMIYQKHPMPTDPRLRYYQRFDYMFVWSKGGPKTFNPIADVLSSKRKQSNGVNRKGDILINTKKKYQTPNYSVRGNVWKYDARNMKTGHPASFPIALACDLIESWSNANDLVFDPFAGSGTTGVAALEKGRRFLGAEKVKEYYDIAQKRLSKAMNLNKQIQMF